MPTCSLKLFKSEIFRKTPFDSIDLANINKINTLQCSTPCQRVPNYVKLSSLLSQYGIPKNIASSIETKEANSYGEVDIGKCIGSCRHVQSQILTVTTQKLSTQKLTPENQKTGYLTYFKNEKLGCVADEYEDLQTEIGLAGEVISGPKIENLVVKSCTCTSVNICN